MKFLIWLLTIIAAAVALTLASHNTGFVQLVYPPYRIELSLTLFAIIQLLFIGLCYTAVRLILAALRLPAYVRAFREQRALHQARLSMIEGLTAFFEGRYAAAEKAAAQSMALGEKSALNPIVAARAAHELREYEKRDAYLADAENKTVGEATMRLMAKTEFQLDQKQPQSALNSLKELSESGNKHIGALTLELKAQQQLRNWDAVLELASQLKKRNGIDATLATQLRQHAWIEKIRIQKQATALHTLLKALPSDLKTSMPLKMATIEGFIKLQDPISAHRLITESLNNQWDSELVALYSEIQAEDTVQQINQAERWLKQHSDDANLLLALGKLCLRQALWGKAQSYLDASISLHPSRPAYTALAQLAEKLGQKDTAFNYDHLAMSLEESTLS
jgi:HemY protein